MKHNIDFRAVIFGAAVFTSIAYAGTVSINPGETINIKPDRMTTVQCELPTSSVESEGNEKVSTSCHKFHSDSQCQGLPVGTVCKMDDGQKKACISSGIFAGAPNCKCK